MSLHYRSVICSIAFAEVLSSSAGQLATSISELCSLQCWSWDANFCSIGGVLGNDVTYEGVRAKFTPLIDLSLTTPIGRLP